MLDTVGIADDLGDEKYQDPAYRQQPEVATRVRELTDTFITMLPAAEAMRLAQQAGLAWSEIRWPEDNLDDEHWQARGVFQDIEHDELGGERFRYVVMPFLCEQMPWKIGNRAAMVGEHTDEVLATDLGLSAGELSALRGAGVV
jgi:crotonobetainyl-CoA:carnitine CoA-transferase CaiB-like acyl-CoA transferase